MTSTEQYNRELYHYGVLGMKWGVRRGNTVKAYQKASKKLDKLDNYITRQQKAMNQRAARADTLSARRLATSHQKAKAVSRAHSSAAKYRTFVRKADRWFRAMDSTFKNTGISLTEAQVKMGERYAKALNMDSLVRY